MLFHDSVTHWIRSKLTNNLNASYGDENTCNECNFISQCKLYIDDYVLYTTSNNGEHKEEGSESNE